MTRLPSVRDVLADLLDAFVDDVLHVVMEDARSRAPKPTEKKRTASKTAKKAAAKKAGAKKVVAKQAKAKVRTAKGRGEGMPGASRRESAPPSRRGKAPKVRTAPMAGEIMDPEALLGGAAMTSGSPPARRGRRKPAQDGGGEARATPASVPAAAPSTPAYRPGETPLVTRTGAVVIRRALREPHRT